MARRKGRGKVIVRKYGWRHTNTLKGNINTNINGGLQK